MKRSCYTVVLEITPTAPLTHGMGNEGNEQVLRLQPYAVTVDGQGETVDVPVVSGSALKATLREHGIADFLQRAGIGDGEVSRDALRLLLKGGKNDAGGQTVSLAEARRLRDLCPALSIFGSMDGGLSIRGSIRVSDVVVWCRELVDAGYLPREVRPLSVSLDGAPLLQGEPIRVWEGREPVDLYGATCVRTYYRHDLLSGSLTHYLAAPEVRQIEDARQANAAAKATKGAPKPDKIARREANESMPHAMQAIVPGTPMVATIRLQDVTDVEFAAFAVALIRWIHSGGYLGGGATKGHGACTVRVAGALRHDLPTGVAPVAGGEPIPVLAAGFDGSEVARAYAAHIESRADAIRAWAATETR